MFPGVKAKYVRLARDKCQKNFKQKQLLGVQSEASSRAPSLSNSDLDFVKKNGKD